VLVGDKERFAVEFALSGEKARHPDLREWLYGTISFWCGGERVGLHEETTLRDVANEAERFLRQAGRRSSEEGLLLDPRDEVMRRIASALFQESGQSDAQVREDWERFSQFIVSPNVDVFDPWRMVLVEGHGKGRLIWSRRGDEAPRECELEEGEFDDVLRAFLAALRLEISGARGLVP